MAFNWQSWNYGQITKDFQPFSCPCSLQLSSHLVGTPRAVPIFRQKVVLLPSQCWFLFASDMPTAKNQHWGGRKHPCCPNWCDEYCRLKALKSDDVFSYQNSCISYYKINISNFWDATPTPLPLTVLRYHRLARENNWHFTTPPLVSPRNDVWEKSAKIPC